MKSTHFPGARVRLNQIILAVGLTGAVVNARADRAYAEAYALAPTLLDAFDVHGDRAADQNYKAVTTHTATKTDWALQDTPQSISVVTAEQIRDQQITSVKDLVRYVPGVSSHQGENNRDQVIFRGNSSSADFFLNGVRDDVQYYRDLYNLDRVEVLRGPNAMIFGRGGGGGVINRVTKEAEFTARREVAVEAGSFDFKRASLDLNQPLNDAFAFRFNAMDEQSGSFRDGVDLSRFGLNPTATFRAGKETKVTLSYEHLRDSRVADRGITSFNGRPAAVPIETFYGDPANSHVGATVDLASVSFEHRRGNLTLRNHTLFGAYDRGYQNFVPGATNATMSTVTLTAYNNSTRRRNLFNQTDITYTANTGPIRHTWLGGAEFGRQASDNFRNTGYFNNTTTSVQVPFWNPTITTPVTWRQSATDANNHVTTNLAAVYAQDQVELTARWQALLGLRFDSFDLKYHNNRNGDNLARRDQLTSPRVGVVYKPSTLVSLYGSYSVSFLPSSGDQFSSLTTVTQQVKPERFTNLEVGAKFELRSNLSLTTAVYRLDRTNTRATDPNDATRIIQTGSQRTDGFEAGLSGAVTNAWTVTAGYSYQHALVRSATTAARAGATVAQVPRHSFSLWNKYRVTEKFSLGLGVISRTRVYAAIDNTVVLPGYASVEAAAFYAFNANWRAQVNVENGLNRHYAVNADNNTNISPGSPLAVRAGVTMRF
jgi:catecholate siderophore receptor